jgi:AraC family transcriptional regulator
VTLSDNQPPAYSIISWERAAQNCASYGGFVAMTGGPHGRSLPEHEHPDLQISVHFNRTTDVQLIASAQPHSGGWQDGERVAVLLLSPALLAEAMDDLSYRGVGAIRSQNCATDGLIRELARAAMIELDRPAALPNRRLYFECLGYTLAGHIVRTYAEIPSRTTLAGALSAHQLARLSEFVDDALDKPLGVSDMASTIGIGTRLFADAFKQTTGITPYQYVVRRRIDHAKRLLLNGRLPLIEVALRLGFASQSHLTAAFTRLTGVTPGRWRSRC